MGSPMPWMVMFLFLAMNLLQIYGYVGNPQAREQFGKMRGIVLDYGLKLDEGNPDYSGEDELAAYYAEYVGNSAALYDGLDMAAILEKRLHNSSFQPTGAYRDFIEGNYRKLQERVEEIRSTGEGDYGFYPGSCYRFHSLLFGRIGRRLLPEMAVLMVLCVLYVTDYERIHKTREMVAATRTGRGILYWKAAAGLGCGIVFGFFLAAATYGYFFRCVPFRGLWEVPVCSAVYAEPRIYGYYPFITFWKLTVGEYLGLTLLVFLGALLAAGSLAAAAWMILRNSYFAFTANVALYMVWYLLCFYNTDSFLDIPKNMNLSALWILCGGWFMEHEMMFSFAGSELWCLGKSAVIAGILFWVGGRRCRRADIC